MDGDAITTMKSIRTTVLTLSVICALIAAMAPDTNSIKPENEIKGIPAGWSDDINLSNHTVEDFFPALALNSDTLYLVWVSNYVDLLFYKSNDEGKSWKTLSTIGHSNELILYPDIDISGQNLHSVWEDREGWNGIYYRNSTDGSESWNPTKRISADGVNAGSPHVYVNNSNVHIAWHDKRDGSDGEIYYRRSFKWRNYI